jgi:BASS family bile acid:Na+ symporter
MPVCLCLAQGKEVKLKPQNPDDGNAPGPLIRLSHFIHKNFLWFLLGSYAIAAAFPSVGLWIKDVSLGQIPLTESRVSLPMALLALLLLNAGLGADLSQLSRLKHSLTALGLGVVANLVVPVAFIFAVAQTMRLWHNPDEVQNILVGLALVASMPIAGSSTAWSQNANGNVALSLGLVLLSTALSPLMTPLGLHAVGLMTTGDYSEDLHELAASGTGAFLLISVVIPSVLGILLHYSVGKPRVATAKPYLKLANSAVLLVLNYSNASVSLPQAIQNPDADFLVVTLTITAALCIVAFASGWLVARVLKVDFAEKVALMFGLGMNNNGTGLVLASLALADHPQVMLPIIFYNLVQHLVAGSVDFVLSRRPLT